MIEPAGMALIAFSFAASKVFHKVADDAVESLWNRTKKAIQRFLKSEPAPESLTPTVMLQALAEEPEVLTALTSLYGDSIALRRAETQRSLLDGARILWIDDYPESTTWERRVLESFGAAFVTVQSTASAVAVARADHFDAVISDIGRDTGESGLAGLPAVREAARGVPLVFYIAYLEPGVPPGAHGITNDPEELIHLVLDVLARTRS